MLGCFVIEHPWTRKPQGTSCTWAQKQSWARRAEEESPCRRTLTAVPQQGQRWRTHLPEHLTKRTVRPHREHCWWTRRAGPTERTLRNVPDLNKQLLACLSALSLRTAPTRGGTRSSALPTPTAHLALKRVSTPRAVSRSCQSPWKWGPEAMWSQRTQDSRCLPQLCFPGA